MLVERCEDGFLRWEVEVDGAQRDVRSLGDVRDRRPAEAPLGEDAARRREDFVAAGGFRKLGALVAVEDGGRGHRVSTECGSFWGAANTLSTLSHAKLDREHQKRKVG